ncbi:hypothetical protein [Paenarthrobacter sp. A20]|uniref:hypothetical protein n=1 Tax=Paenarthrobacter sp. A20 TaxID=2817891 RepID=UPI00209DE6E6|nr:hypothetical protein [Paenarthrobacter sp. A20]MCP1411006.1 ATP-dependent protease HslVU (ClpYQ) peptidase subunit [Paenarthrobacter sp. A20]
MGGPTFRHSWRACADARPLACSPACLAILAGTGVLAIGAAIVARVEHEFGVIAIGGAGVMILAAALAMRPKNPSMSQQSAS